MRINKKQDNPAHTCHCARNASTNNNNKSDRIFKGSTSSNPTLWQLVKHCKEHKAAHFLFWDTFQHETQTYKSPNFNHSQSSFVISIFYFYFIFIFFLKSKFRTVPNNKHNFEVLSRCNSSQRRWRGSTMGCLCVRVTASPAAASAPVTWLLPQSSTCCGPFIKP